MTDGILLVLSTFESREQAEPVARALVDERLAACANLLPGCLSIYRWQGAVERAEEALMLVKTTRDRYPALERRLRELHPYDLPEIVAVAPERVLPAYADWVAGETRQAESDADPQPSDLA
ncbi:MAG TPA: divalent-cation tolerance protein CutA [Burkholderiaceae bacterium]|nr:divalent-cation tolerance protein CutA [Burkholderiaceae bacterium]